MIESLQNDPLNQPDPSKPMTVIQVVGNRTKLRYTTLRGENAIGWMVTSNLTKDGPPETSLERN